MVNERLESDRSSRWLGEVLVVGIGADCAIGSSSSGGPGRRRKVRKKKRKKKERKKEIRSCSIMKKKPKDLE